VSNMGKKLGALLLVGLLVAPPSSQAIVGQAEKFDVVEEEDLSEFHEKLISEEKASQRSALEAMIKEMEEEQEEELQEGEEDEDGDGDGDGEGEEGEGEEEPDEELEEVSREVDEELEELKKLLLGIQKKKRFRAGATGVYNYDSNFARQIPRHEEGDAKFNYEGFVEVDLSKKKTDIRFEVRGGKQYSLKNPNSDM